MSGFYSKFEKKIEILGFGPYSKTKVQNSHTMKIRIKGNSIRLRLTKPEVGMFCREGSCAETIDFGTNSLTYSLEAKEKITDLEASYTADRITVYMPMEAKQNWFDSTRVGYSTTMARDTENHLSILVEKDFTCMDNTLEDQSDTYPNPKR